MWERLTPTDIHQARDRLTLSRADMLRKHAEELKGLDDEHDEIEMLERLIGSFTQKYVNSEAAQGNLAHRRVAYRSHVLKPRLPRSRPPAERPDASSGRGPNPP